MDEMLYNLDSLITSTVKAELSNIPLLSDKIEYLFCVMELDGALSADVIAEINNFYAEKTGEIYSPVFLSGDEKELILEYAARYDNFDNIKQVIGGIASEYSKENYISDVQKKIAEAEEQEKNQQRSDGGIIIENLLFDDDTKEQENNKKSLKEQFIEARKKREFEKNKQEGSGK